MSFPYSTSAWQTNTPAPGLFGNLSSTGVVSGAYMRSRIYTDFAISDTAAIAYFSKSSDAIHPLPLDLISFSVQGKQCMANIQFEIAKASAFKKFQLQHSADGIVFSTIASFLKDEDSLIYTFIDKNAISGKNYYRLVLIEANGNYLVSNTLERHIDCEKLESQYVLFPNPASQHISISGLTKFSEVRILDLHGRVLLGRSANSTIEYFDISQLSDATYLVQVFSNNGKISNIKFVKN